MKTILIDRFRAVFPIHPVPKRVLLDERDETEFADEIRQHFVSKSWDLVTLDDWINTASVEVIAHFMTAQAFHYYLPSILSTSVGSADYIDWGLRAILPHNKSREPKGDWWASFFACFNAEQKKVLREYMAYVSDVSADYSEEKYLVDIGLKKIWA